MIAALNELVDYGYATEADVREARLIAGTLTASLVGLIRYFEKQPARPKPGAPQRRPKNPAI